MSKLLPTLSLPFLCLCTSLAAQDGSKAQEPAKPAATAPAATGEDITAKDAAIKAIDAFIAEKKIDTKKPQWRLTLSEPPKQTFDANAEYFMMMTTSEGALKIRLLPAEAPMHVTCGIYLARLGYFDGLNFHRIIPNFMAQGGCPLGTGTAGPGYTIEGEFSSGRKHDKPGLLSTANTGAPKSDGSQFFLTFVPTSWLDGKHTIWGEVVEGMDTVKALEKLGSQSGKVAKPPKIENVAVAVMAKAAKTDKPADAPKDGGKKGD